MLVESEGGILLKRGTEYLSGQELCSLSLWDLKRPTGKLNRGGQRLWESIDSIYAENYADAKKIMQYFYLDQEIQLARVRRGYVFRLEEKNEQEG